jgi:hypothetical protein
MMRTRRTILAAALLCSALAADRLAGQGTGVAGAQILQLEAGARAAALSGAYSAATADADVVFYNPAGGALLAGAGALSYQRLVDGIAFGSLAGALRVGRATLLAGVAYLDGGEIDVLEPDPAYGGQRGRPTGERVGARETATRLAAAVPLAGGRVRLGAAAGFVGSEVAGTSRSAPLFDVGAQLGLGPAAVGLALRNLGPALPDGGGGMPTEVRLGGSAALSGATPFGAMAALDLIADIQTRVFGFAGGIEAGFTPVPGVSAALRLGYGHDAGDGLGSLRIGGGVGIGLATVDYTFQQYEYFGAVHRIGVRWTRVR